jgi:hypothetical protein
MHMYVCIASFRPYSDCSEFQLNYGVQRLEQNFGAKTCERYNKSTITTTVHICIARKMLLISRAGGIGGLRAGCTGCERSSEYIF